jgi:hypothetical protein
VLPRAATVADGFDRWLTSLGTLRLAGVLLGIAVCVAALFGVLLDGRERAQHAYESAQVCTAGSAGSVGSAGATGDCVVLLDATISGKSVTGGKGPHEYLLTLDGPDPVSGQFTVLKEPAWDGMDVGDGVVATVWKGQVVRIADGSIAVDTSLAPSVQSAIFVALLASSVAWIVAFGLFAVRIFEAGRGRALGWSRVLVPVDLVAALSVFVFPFGSIAGSTGGSALAAVLGGVGCSALAGGYFVVDWIRKRDKRDAEATLLGRPV